MWYLIVSVPDHCLSFYFKLLHMIHLEGKIGRFSFFSVGLIYSLGVELFSVLVLHKLM